MFLNFFSHAPSVLVVFVQASPPMPCEDCCPSPPKKLQMGLFDIYKHFSSSRFFDSVTQIKSSLRSPYCAEACYEWRGPSPLLSAWATQLRRNIATMASRWRHCADLSGPGIEPQIYRTDSVRLATELTGR